MHPQDVLSYRRWARPCTYYWGIQCSSLTPVQLSTDDRPLLQYVYRTSALPAALAHRQDNAEQHSSIFSEAGSLSEQNTADPLGSIYLFIFSSAFLKSSQTLTKPGLWHIAGARDGSNSKSQGGAFRLILTGLKNSCNCSIYSIVQVRFGLSACSSLFSL